MIYFPAARRPQEHASSAGRGSPPRPSWAWPLQTYAPRRGPPPALLSGARRLPPAHAPAGLIKRSRVLSPFFSPSASPLSRPRAGASPLPCIAKYPRGPPFPARRAAARHQAGSHTLPHPAPFGPGLTAFPAQKKRPRAGFPPAAGLPPGFTPAAPRMPHAPGKAAFSNIPSPPRRCQAPYSLFRAFFR
jgi:hypothetical protein